MLLSLSPEPPTRRVSFSTNVGTQSSCSGWLESVNNQMHRFTWCVTHRPFVILTTFSSVITGRVYLYFSAPLANATKLYSQRPCHETTTRNVPVQFCQKMHVLHQQLFRRQSPDLELMHNLNLPVYRSHPTTSLATQPHRKPLHPSPYSPHIFPYISPKYSSSSLIWGFL